MNVPRQFLIGLALVLAGSGGALAASAFASVPTPSPTATPQEKQLDKACIATVMSIQKVLAQAANTQAKTITSPLEVVVPGALAGEIAFNRSARSIRLTGLTPPSTTSLKFGCGESSAGGQGLGPGRSRVVSTLERTFTTAGHYTLTFRLNQTGRRLLAQLAAAEHTYRRQHPHGNRPPSLAFGVSLDYAPSG